MAISCAECKITFQSRTNLTRHLRSIHDNEQFSCDECGKCFTRKDRLLEHIQTKHGGKPPRKKKETHTKNKTRTLAITISCAECKKIYHTRSNFLRHLRSAHENKRYYCGECEKCFTRKSWLQEHIHTVHGEQNESEETLGSSDRFAQKQQTNVDTIKRYSCPHCNKVFRKKGSLPQHLLYFCPVLLDSSTCQLETT